MSNLKVKGQSHKSSVEAEGHKRNFKLSNLEKNQW